MNDQSSLFDPPARLSVRSSDPVTSLVAAKALPLRARQQEVVDALRFLAVSSTADEVRDLLRGRGMWRERNEVASRLSELEGLGLVRKVGVRAGRRGRPVATWALTGEGRAA